MIRRPPRSTLDRSSAASDVYKRQILILYSCTKDKLNQPALGLVDEATLANKNGVEGLLIGAYALLDGVSGGDGYGSWGAAASNWIYGSICGSEAYKGSTAPDIPQINVLSKFT